MCFFGLSRRLRFPVSTFNLYTLGLFGVSKSIDNKTCSGSLDNILMTLSWNCELCDLRPMRITFFASSSVLKSNFSNLDTLYRIPLSDAVEEIPINNTSLLSQSNQFRVTDRLSVFVIKRFLPVVKSKTTRNNVPLPFCTKATLFPFGDKFI